MGSFFSAPQNPFEPEWNVNLIFMSPDPSQEPRITLPYLNDLQTATFYITSHHAIELKAIDAYQAFCATWDKIQLSIKNNGLNNKGPINIVKNGVCLIQLVNPEQQNVQDLPVTFTISQRKIN